MDVRNNRKLYFQVISVAGFSVNKSPTDKTKPRQRSNNRSSGEPTNNNEMLYSKTKEGSEIGNYTRKSDMYDNNGWNGSAINSPFNQSETSMTISLLDGTYDENESAASFQEALREWRTAGSTSKQDTVSLPGKAHCSLSCQSNHVVVAKPCCVFAVFCCLSIYLPQIKLKSN